MPGAPGYAALDGAGAHRRAGLDTLDELHRLVAARGARRVRPGRRRRARPCRARPRLAPAGPVAGRRPGSGQAGAVARARPAVERQRRADRRHGQAGGAALGRWCWAPRSSSTTSPTARSTTLHLDCSPSHPRRSCWWQRMSTTSRPPAAGDCGRRTCIGPTSSADSGCPRPRPGRRPVGGLADRAGGAAGRLRGPRGLRPRACRRCAGRRAPGSRTTRTTSSTSTASSGPWARRTSPGP